MRTWERSPQHYADVLATSLAGQALFDYAPLAERARRVLSKLRQVPRVDPVGPRQHQGSARASSSRSGWRACAARCASSTRICRARLAISSDLHLLGDLADASTEAATAIGGYIDYLEKDLAPRSKGSFRLGREKFEQKLRLDEGITLDADRLLAIAMRELQRDAGGVPPRRLAR